MEKQPWGAALGHAQGRGALEARAPAKGVEIDALFPPATFIERSLDHLSHALVLGCVLGVAVLASFFFEWRTAFSSLVTIPLSLFAAGIVLYYQGGTINTMVLAGLVIAVGVVVDDAIIDVENIMRRLRLSRAAGSPVSAFKVVLDASLEVRSAVVIASLIVTLVFVPVFFLEGLAGSFFRPLAFSYVLAILASMLVALTVTPALSLMLLPGAPERRGEAPLARWLKRRFRAVLPWFVARPAWAVVFLVAAFTLTPGAAALWARSFAQLPRDRLPDALGREARHVARSDAAHHRTREPELRAIPACATSVRTSARRGPTKLVGPNFTEL